MSVNINIINCGLPVSDETTAAQLLKEKFEEHFAKTPAKGKIYILTNVLLYGYDNNEIDLIVLGSLKNYTISMNTPYHNKSGISFPSKNLDVNVEDFCFTIELKQHSLGHVRVTPMKGIEVEYLNPHYWENASTQSNNQKTALLKTLKKNLNLTPRIVNLLWLYNINGPTFIGNRDIPNVLYGKSFNIKTLWETAVLVSDKYVPKLDNNTSATLSANGDKPDSIQKLIVSISERPIIKGEITRKRVEMITDDKLKISLNDLHYDRGLLLFKGKAGTGKTSALLRIAYLLKTEENARCLILSYNRALVQDMCRTFAFLPRDARPDGSSIDVSTMQKFFISIMPCFDVEVPVFDKDYTKNYKESMRKLNEAINDKDDVALLKMEKPELGWNYVLVDEAQDWSNDEKDVLMKLYSDGHLIVADGVDQIVIEGNVPQNWIVGRTKDQFEKKEYQVGLRQGANLTSFVNDFARISDNDWAVKVPNDGVPGGDVYIFNTDYFIENFEEKMLEINNLLTSTENQPYDLMLLTTKMFVDEVKGDDNFSKELNTRLAQVGLKIFDGVNSAERNGYPIDQIRAYRYESCRGLEGWAVVCLDFDGFMQHRADVYVDKPTDNVMNSREDRLKEYLNAWALMPITRPIQNLYITISDSCSDVALKLKELARLHSDYIHCYLD